MGGENVNGLICSTDGVIHAMERLNTRRWRSCRRSSGPKSTGSTLHPAHREGQFLLHATYTLRTRVAADTRVATEKLAVALSSPSCYGAVYWFADRLHIGCAGC